MARRIKASLPVVPWYEGGLAFGCTQCGNCCTGPPGYVWTSDEEIERLAGHLGLTVEATVKTYLRRVGGSWSLRERKTARGEHPCIFLDETLDPAGKKAPVRKCTVYAVRPLQCRTWPFWDGNLQDEDAWAHAGVRCPGLNRGRKFAFEEIEAVRTAEDWPERPPSSSS